MGRGDLMKKCIFLMLICFTIILSACTQAKEDTQEYSGIIGDGNTLGYEYTVIKEQNKFSWKVGYKGDITMIEESASNEEDLASYMNAVNESSLVLAKLIVSVSYILIVIITTLILYKKNKKLLKDSGIIITIFTGIALYIAFQASFDLSNLLQNAKY